MTPRGPAKLVWKLNMTQSEIIQSYEKPSTGAFKWGQQTRRMWNFNIWGTMPPRHEAEYEHYFSCLLSFCIYFFVFQLEDQILLWDAEIENAKKYLYFQLRRGLWFKKNRRYLIIILLFFSCTISPTPIFFFNNPNLYELTWKKDYTVNDPSGSFFLL